MGPKIKFKDTIYRLLDLIFGTNLDHFDQIGVKVSTAFPNIT